MGIAATPHGQCDKWDAQGLRGHHNYYYQFTDRGTPCEVDGLNYLRTPSTRGRFVCIRPRELQHRGGAVRF